MNRPIFVFILILLGLSAGCRTLAPEPGAGEDPVLPTAFRLLPGTAGKGMSGPGRVFDNVEYARILQRALDGNLDIKAKQARVEQARALLEKERASFFPTLDFSVGGSRSHTRTDTGKRAHTSDGSHTWDAGLTGSWSPDIWGETLSAEKALALSLAAADLDLTQAYLDTAVQVSDAWLDVITARKQKAISDQQVTTNQTLLSLQKLRFSNGQASALDVSQQREALAEAASQAPILEKQTRLSLNTLAFLMGSADMASAVVNTTALPQAFEIGHPGIPARLLENRPDIRAAQLRLSAARWDVAAAKADLYPSLSLTARALFSAGELDLLFKNWVASLAASLAGPILDGGKRRAEVGRVRALAQEQAAAYARVVAAAVKAVEDNLVSIQKQAEYVALLEEELAVARLTLKDAMLQYRNGKSSYLSYLTAWTAIQRMERQLVSEQAQYLKYRVSLMSALGLDPVTGRGITTQLNQRKKP